MCRDDILRLLAGAFVLLSVALGWFVNPAFFLFTAFVGVNLLQSGLTGWCPAMWILRRIGVNDCLDHDHLPHGGQH